MLIKEEYGLILLPSEGKSRLMFLTNKGKERNNLVYSRKELPNLSDVDLTLTHQLYVFSDEEPKIGEWYIDLMGNEVRKRESHTVITPKGLHSKHYDRKIIATSDENLEIEESIGSSGIPKAFYKVPQIEEKFILDYVSEYNKGNIIERVMGEIEETFTCLGRMAEHIMDCCDSEGKCTTFRQLNLTENYEIKLSIVDNELNEAITNLTELIYNQKKMRLETSGLEEVLEQLKFHEQRLSMKQDLREACWVFFRDNSRSNIRTKEDFNEEFDKLLQFLKTNKS